MSLCIDNECKCVGIDNYQDARISPLRYCVADIKEFLWESVRLSFAKFLSKMKSPETEG